jgi:hypothetical protein
MTVYCKVCGWKIGQVTFGNIEEMKLRYANHFIIHKPKEIIGSICWTTEKKEKSN